MDSMRSILEANDPDFARLLLFYRRASAEKLTINRLFSELCWIVYSSGFKYEILMRHWPGISRAFCNFDVRKVAEGSCNQPNYANQICRQANFNNLAKASWCLFNAHRILELEHEMAESGGLQGYFATLNCQRARDIIGVVPDIMATLRFKGIGQVTIFHLLKNVGIDIFKPDIHVCRILASLGITHSESDPIEIVCNAMELLSHSTGMSLCELDTLIFCFGKLGTDLPTLT
jgi:3-methyladenine DNA glycosylase Tag